MRNGGTAILSETPEIYGAEHLLTRRAATPEIGRKLVERIRWWEDYCARSGGEMNNNPSPGNKAGGLTTILEKSLGAAAKGGTTALNEVYKYAEPVTAKGFVFMDTPGYDPVSATGQVAGGANVLAFTTGRGSAYGCKPTPSVKLATNNDVYRKMIEDMDINCGDVVDGVSIADKGREIFDKILAVASGEGPSPSSWAMATRNSRPGRSERPCDERAPALLFDLDGTLVDSDPKHLAAFQRVFASFGIAVDQTTYERDIHGASNESIGRVFLSHLTTDERRAVLDAKEAAYRSDVIDIEPIAGAVALLDFADRRGLKRAVVTNAPRANAEKVLSRARARTSSPDHGDRVGAGALQTRPSALPDRAGAHAEPSASRSVAFEDSPSGVRAAAAAGLAVVGLTTTLDAAALLRAGATIAANDFTDPRIFALIEEPHPEQAAA